jgi:hypothetical protein
MRASRCFLAIVLCALSATSVAAIRARPGMTARARILLRDLV